MYVSNTLMVYTQDDIANQLVLCTKKTGLQIEFGVERGGHSGEGCLGIPACTCYIFGCVFQERSITVEEGW